MESKFARRTEFDKSAICDGGLLSAGEEPSQTQAAASSQNRPNSQELVTLVILSKIFDARWTTVLSLLLPTLVGVMLIGAVGEETRRYFFIVNFRMMTVPSSARQPFDVDRESFDLRFIRHMDQSSAAVPSVFTHSQAPEWQSL
jgi:hypothetical protein